MQECAKICVKKCKRAKNWKIDFADVCIFIFDGSHICRFLPILRPPTVPRSHFSYPKTKTFTLIISHLYLQIVTSASVMLDISIDNIASINVAKKCAFSKPDDRKEFYDMEHPEVGMRFRWFKQLPGNRSSLFNQAVHYYRQKAYTEAADAFKKALNEPYIPGTPFTDAQIYSNLGMALSSMRCYNEAFQCLKKAQRLGLNNPSIEQELLWLKNNIGLF